MLAFVLFPSASKNTLKRMGFGRENNPSLGHPSGGPAGLFRGNWTWIHRWCLLKPQQDIFCLFVFDSDSVASIINFPFVQNPVLIIAFLLFSLSFYSTDSRFTPVNLVWVCAGWVDSCLVFVFCWVSVGCHFYKWPVINVCVSDLWSQLVTIGNPYG